MSGESGEKSWILRKQKTFFQLNFDFFSGPCHIISHLLYNLSSLHLLHKISFHASKNNSHLPFNWQRDKIFPAGLIVVSTNQSNCPLIYWIKKLEPKQAHPSKIAKFEQNAKRTWPFAFLLAASPIAEEKLCYSCAMSLLSLCLCLSCSSIPGKHLKTPPG